MQKIKKALQLKSGLDKLRPILASLTYGETKNRIKDLTLKL